MSNGFGSVKIPKTEAPEKTPYTIFYPFSDTKDKRVWNKGYLQFLSIDPGRVNYAFRIERRYHSGVKKGKIVCLVFAKIKIEEYITDDDNSIINKTYDNLELFFDSFIERIKECHYIIIERQLPHNYKAVRISQHTLSYLSFVLKKNSQLPVIIELDSKIKGKVLGVPRGTTGHHLKKWAVEVATEMFIEQDDQFSLDVLKKHKSKKDDLCDTKLQIEAVWILLKIDLLAEKLNKKYFDNKKILRKIILSDE